MSRRDVLISIATVAGVALFLIVLVELLMLRYQRGDLYPASSTLRPDPLGTRAYYEALPDAGPYDVSRGFVSLRRELAEHPATLLLLGVKPSNLGLLTPDEISELDDYVGQGGRVVLTLAPTQDGGEQDDKPEKEKRGKPKLEKDKPLPVPVPEPPGQARTAQEKYERSQYRKDQETEERFDPDRYVPGEFHPSLQALWGFGWANEGGGKSSGKDKPSAKDNAAAATVEHAANGDMLAVRAGATPTEARVPWQSPVSFLRLDPSWQVVYQCGGKPVLIDQKRGKGEIIVASDSYFVSNEALRDDRVPQLLAWMAGPRGLLLFDETHLGTEEKQGVMVLARRYHLEGYLYGLLIVAGLFLWRQSVPLVPPAPVDPRTSESSAVSGKDSRSGLLNLLRRNITPGQLLATCFAEWRRQVSPGRSNERTAEMESLLASPDAAKPGQIVETYRRLCELNPASRTPSSYANQP